MFLTMDGDKNRRTDNMKKYIFALIILLPFFAGCKKASGPEAATIDDGRMRFSADFSITKSHFENDSSPQLLWDLTDRIAVYSKQAFDSFMDDDHFLGSIAEAIDISEIASGGLTATFEATTPKTDWFPEGNPFTPEQYTDIKEDDMPFVQALYNAWINSYVFFAYYPCTGEPGGFETFSIARPADPDHPDPTPELYQYIPMSVSAVQDGASYSEYQILYDPGYPESDGDPSETLISKTDIMANPTSSVSFNFRPVTSMLRFTLQLPSGSAKKTRSNIKISIEGDSDQNSIAGDAMLMLFQYGAKDALPISMEKSNHVNYLWPAASGNTSITISEEQEVSSTPGNYLYAVMIPFHTTNSDVKIRFSAKDANDVTYASVRKVPLCFAGEHEYDYSYYGFREGYRYNAAVTLYPTTDPLADNAGSYIEDEW